VFPADFFKKDFENFYLENKGKSLIENFYSSKRQLNTFFRDDSLLSFNGE
jgi:hypothetical protein